MALLKTNLFVGLVVLIAGYLICSRLHLKRYQLKHSSGYHTFLLSAGAGLLVFFITYLLRLPLVIWGPDFSLVGKLIEIGLPAVDVDVGVVFLIEISLAMLIFSAFGPPFLYLLTDSLTQYNKDELFMGAFLEQGDNPEFTALLISSHQYGLPIIFTLSDRKVYIGYPVNIKAEKFNDLGVLPVVSGYRDKDNLKFFPVTPYQSVIDDKLEGEDYEKFLITLPIREIVHAHLIDLTLLDVFLQNEL
tara:strand:- start:1679 stop:2416 length:738 start_codon:yes stop_codon:yes gene_type:complete